MCDKNDALNGGMCVHNIEPDIDDVYTCPAGYILEGEKCLKETNFVSSVDYVCPYGGTIGSVTYKCPSDDYKLDGSRCIKKYETLASGTSLNVIEYNKDGAVLRERINSGTDDKCPLGGVAISTSYDCGTGFTLKGSSCVKETSVSKFTASVEVPNCFAICSAWSPVRSREYIPSYCKYI